MNNPFFETRSSNGIKFLCNKETGQWCLIDEDFQWEKDKKLLKLMNRKMERRNFVGTNLFVINTTRRCNFRCKYCYLGDLRGQPVDMKIEIGQKLVDNALQLGQKDIFFVFHGSEPLLNFNFIKQLVKYGEEKERESSKKIHFGLQTNGFLFSDRVMSFLESHNIDVCVSLDGTREAHDKVRVLKEGSPTFAIVKKNLEKLKKTQELSVITVVTKYNVENLEEILENYKENDITTVYFYPVSPLGGQEFMPDNEILIENMISIFDSTLDDLINKEKILKISNLASVLSALILDKHTDSCIECGTGIHQPALAVDTEGDVYPCDSFWEQKEFRIANIKDSSFANILNSERNFRIYRNVDAIDGCRECKWKKFCGGGCPADSFGMYGDLNHRSPYCNYYKGVFKYVVKKIPFLYEKNLLQEILNWG